jgi:drug/metabolite transporter (DMT)-like permease
MNYTLGVLQVILAGVGFGFLGIFAHLAYARGLTVGELLPLRFTLASLILWAGLILFSPRLIKIHFKQFLYSCGLGVFGYAVFSTLYFKSLEGVSVPVAAMLLFTFPFFVNLGAHYILKEKMSRIQVASLIVASIGLVLLLWGDFSVNKISSVFFGLGAAIAYSIYVLVSSQVQKNVVPISSSLYVITAAAIGLWGFHQPAFSRITGFSYHDWLIIAGVAIVSTILPMTLFLSGLQKMSSAKASVLVMIEPVTAAVASFLILNEQLSVQQIVGASLIVGSVLLDAMKK